MTQQAENAYYPDDESLAMDYADAVNEEIKDLFAAGADIVQLDEPYVQARPEAARAYAVKAINRALEGVDGKTALHLCFGYAAVIKTEKPSGYSFLPELEAAAVDQISIEAAQPGLDPAILAHLPSKEILYGVIDMNDPDIERPETVAARLREALKVVPADRLVAAPDCGMKYLARETAFGKLRAMVEGAAIVRREGAFIDVGMTMFSPRCVRRSASTFFSPAAVVDGRDDRDRDQARKDLLSDPSRITCPLRGPRRGWRARPSR